MVQPGRGLGQLDEVPEVFDRAVAPALVEIHHEGAAIAGREDHGVAANPDIVGRIARVLGELLRRGLQDLAQHAGLKLDQDAFNHGSGALPQFEHFGIVAEFDADFCKDAVGGFLDPQQRFLAHDVIGRDAADDVGTANTLGSAAPCSLAGAAPPALAFAFGCNQLRIVRHRFLHKG